MGSMSFFKLVALCWASELIVIKKDILAFQVNKKVRELLDYLMDLFGIF